jgi:hypothetical protein
MRKPNKYQILARLAAGTILCALYFFGFMAVGTSAAASQNGIDLVSDLTGAHSVKSADIDGNGTLDIIAVSRESGQVIWLQNQGGPYPEFARHQVGYLQGAYDVYLADLDRDGDVDILVVGVGELNPASAEQSLGATGALVWLENNLRQGGWFTPHVIATNLHYSVAIHVVDLDRDGDMDLLLAARDGNSITWYENIGGAPPTFVPHLVSANALGAVSVHAGDMNGDGAIDIVSASENDNKISIYYNNGARPPTFYEVVAYQPLLPPPGENYAKAVYVADIDSDGDLDIAYVGENNNEVGWLENVGGSPPVFVPHILSNDANHAKDIVAADLDGDGDIDLLVASSGDNKVAWFENNGARPPAFTLRLISTGAQGARAVHAADLDGDGDLDVLSASRTDGRVTWYPNPAIRRSAVLNAATQNVVYIRQGARGVHAADVDGDGHIDLLSITENEVAWHQNNGAIPPSFTTHIVGTNLSGGRWVTAGDLDGDGDLDIVAASKRDNQIAWYENLGGNPPTFASHIVTQQALGVRAVLIADLDGDGDLDLYSASDTDNAISWYENLGGRPPTFQRHIVSQQAMYARSVYAADLDGDGDLDLMSASQDDNKVAWYENLGGTPLQWREHVIDSGASGVQHIHADDFDGDGDIDIVVAVEYDNTIRWYENLGGSPPTFRMHFVSQSAPAVHAVYSGDIDQDGDIDIFAAIEDSNTIAWYENLGGSPPTFREHIVVNNAQIAHNVYAADIDGDGDLDLISASRGDGKIAWYENVGGHYAVSAEQSPDHPNVLHLLITHRGRPGDPDLALTNFEVQLQDESGTPLQTDQANLLIQRINVYRVNCCEKTFDAATSPLMSVAMPLELSGDGRQLLRFLPDDPNTRIPAGGVAAFAIVFDGNANSCQNGVNAFRAVNVVSGRVAQNSANGLPLRAEYMRRNGQDALPTITERSTLLINEFMAENDSVSVDPANPRRYSDWIEIYNTSAMPINLGGKFLTDNLAMPDKHLIADGVTIPPYGYLVFIADGEPERGPMHLNFKLDKAGEAIGLYETGTTGFRKLDEVVFGEQPRNLSSGRYPNGGDTWQRLAVPTPGGPNVDFVSSDDVHLPFVYRAVACP